MERSRARSSNSAATARTISPSSTGSDRSGTAASSRDRSSSSPDSADSRSSSRRAVPTWRSASSSSIWPARMSSSSSSIVPWSIVSGVRSSCEAVETNARRAASWRRSSSCMRASARARSPTSSRRSSRGICASGPSSVIRSAAERRRPSRRSRVEESAIASSGGDREADDARRAGSASRTWLTSVETSVSCAVGDQRAGELAGRSRAASRRSRRRRRSRSPIRRSRIVCSAALHASRRRDAELAVVDEAGRRLGRVARHRVASITRTRASVWSLRSVPTAANAPLVLDRALALRSSRPSNTSSKSPFPVDGRRRAGCRRSARAAGPASAGSTISAIAPSVTALVATSASSSRQRRPRRQPPSHDSRKR